VKVVPHGIHVKDRTAQLQNSGPGEMSRTVRLNMKYHGLRKKSPDDGEAQKWCTVAAVYLHRF